MGYHKLLILTGNNENTQSLTKSTESQSTAINNQLLAQNWAAYPDRTRFNTRSHGSVAAVMVQWPQSQCSAPTITVACQAH